MSFFWANKHSRMHSLQKTWPFWQQRGSMKGLRQRQQASKGLIESLPSLSFCVPYPSFRFSSYVKKARSLLFFECLCGIFSLLQNPNPRFLQNPNTMEFNSTNCPVSFFYSFPSHRFLDLAHTRHRFCRALLPSYPSALRKPKIKLVKRAALAQY